MQYYETSATVQSQGEVHVSGVPFEPGTEVEVTISPKIHSAKTGGANSNDRLARLFKALDKARNVESIGSLKREELYDRNGND
jgi:hypothetical protein